MEAEPTLDVVYYFDGLNDSIDGGFNAMQDAMTYDKDIRVVVVTSYNAAIGAQNYIMSQPGVVCDEYGIFSGGLDSTLDQMLADAAAGNGVFRGSAAPLGTSAYYLGDTCRKALLGEIEAPYENLFEFDFRTVEGFVYEG